jgi:hypothetical protein
MSDLQPVHMYTLTRGNTRQYVLIDGGYCDGPTNQQIEADHPGWTVTDRTWRADWTQLAAPSNSEPGYLAGLAFAERHRYGPPAQAA